MKKSLRGEKIIPQTAEPRLQGVSRKPSSPSQPPACPSKGSLCACCAQAVLGGQGKREAVLCHQRDGDGCDRLSAVIMGEAAACGDREGDLVFCPICSCLLHRLASLPSRGGAAQLGTACVSVSPFAIAVTCLSLQPQTRLPHSPGKV